MATEQPKANGDDQDNVQRLRDLARLCDLAGEQVYGTWRDLLEDSAAEIEVLRQKVRQLPRGEVTHGD